MDPCQPRTEEDVVLVSALEHFSYCPRQCGLIHVEQVYEENVFTLRGSRAHRRSDEPTTRWENGVRIERALPVWSDRLGLTGVADVVEFHPGGRVYPVEHKSSPARGQPHAAYQLCAQALCLEEMLGIAVDAGAIYAYRTRRREEIRLDGRLRSETESLVAAIRDMQRSGRLPAPVNDRRCPNCSLVDACLPDVLSRAASRAARALWFLPEGDGGC